jgi:hypothetical protein
MSPFELALKDLARLGYESQRLGTLQSQYNNDQYHVYAMGRHPDRQVTIVREGTDGSYQIYVSLRGDMGIQSQALLQWLQQNVGAVQEEVDDG